MTDPLPHSPHCATLVVDEAVTKPEALAAVARASGTHVRRGGTSRPYVALEGDAWAEVDVPKFGEAPPLAIDVYSPLSREEAEAVATELMARLSSAAGWRIQPKFSR